MKNLVKRKDGQFVIIAAVIVAIMMISLSTILHEAATYYTHEPWEEYTGLMGNIELNFKRLMEISLTNYTQTQNSSILRQNLERWQNDLSQIYSGRGVYADFSFPNENGLYYNNLTNPYSSMAKAELSVNISSIGLKGYRINSEVSLNVAVYDSDPNDDQVELVVTKENGVAVEGLLSDNFTATSNPPVQIEKVDDHYDEQHVLVYTLTFNDTLQQPFILQVCDQRGIIVSAVYPPGSSPPPSPSPSPSSSPTPSPSPSPSPTPGEPMYLILRPAGEGSQTQLSADPEDANWKCVNDTNPDNDATFVYTTKNSYKTDTYLSPNPLHSGNISSVTVYAVVSKTNLKSGGGGTARTALRVSGNVYYGTATTLTDAYQPIFTTYDTNPNGGGAWTWSDIDGLEGGLELRASKATAKCTQVYVEVNYYNP